MEKNLHEEFKFRKIKKPNKFIAFTAIKVMSLISKKRGVTFSYSEKYKQYKNKQMVLLSWHPSRDDFIYVFSGFGRCDVHAVCGYQNIFQKTTYPILKRLGVIAKYLYQPDVVSVKQMLQVVKEGRSLYIAPEGIQSTSGSSHPINPATINLLCKLKLPVAIATLHGSYFTKTRYSRDIKKGKISVNFDMLFTENDFEAFSKEELQKKLQNAFIYNEYEYNKIHKIKFIGEKENIYGLDNIIYKCPKCGSEFNFEINGDTMFCKDCDFSVSMNEYYELSSANGKLPFADVDTWFKWQRNEIRKEIKTPDFTLFAPVELFTVNTKKLDNNYSQLKLGDGKVFLNTKGLSYKGTINGEEVELFFEAKSVHSLSISLDYEMDFYYKQDYYCIKPTENKKHVVKWMLAQEEIHNLYDESWEKARREVYPYED